MTNNINNDYLEYKDGLIAVIGLGYVGLPLAVEFAKQRRVIGFDVSKLRTDELNFGFDRTLEITKRELLEAKYLSITSDKKKIDVAKIYIITVPTPIDGAQKPDLEPLKLASETVGKAISPGDIIIYESTVYPGATEDDCVPIIEKISGLKYNIDFFCGYSPERINPGDKKHKLVNIKKITSGSNPKIANIVDRLYGEIITAGTYMAESIAVAEAAKVIENTQRDLNIALMNELAMIFNKMGIDTASVLNAASTKWNFISFKPGLVGGHCIGVDPYYLTYKAKAIGLDPQVILAGRNTNDEMGNYVAGQLIKKMAQNNLPIKDGAVLIIGLAFKENCPDVRNTRVIDLIFALGEYGTITDVYDPVVDVKIAKEAYGIDLIDKPKTDFYDAIIFAVPHEQIVDEGLQKIRSYGRKSAHVFYDLKSIFPIDDSDLRL
jgi:UDP-N-acetyl-D-glucosamine/UDP-N-acetyl-D-galactosamine dehydrogenase